MESLFIEDRKKITIKGADKMISSTATETIVEIGGANLVINGTELEITSLNLQDKEVVLTGNINAVKYATKHEKTSLLKRIFK